MTAEDHKLLNVALSGMILILVFVLAALGIRIVHSPKPAQDPSQIEVMIRPSNAPQMYSFSGDRFAFGEVLCVSLLKKCGESVSKPIPIIVRVDDTSMTANVSEFVARLFTNISMSSLTITLTNLPPYHVTNSPPLDQQSGMNFRGVIFR